MIFFRNKKYSTVLGLLPTFDFGAIRIVPNINVVRLNLKKNFAETNKFHDQSFHQESISKGIFKIAVHYIMVTPRALRNSLPLVKVACEKV